MGRSVNFLSHAAHVAFFTAEEQAQDQFLWDEMTESIQECICEIMPSMEPCNHSDGRECRVIASNNFARIGISEYGGLVSLSIGIDPQSDLVQLANHWCSQVAPKIDKVAAMHGEHLEYVGTMSDGYGVYQAAK